MSTNSSEVAAKPKRLIPINDVLARLHMSKTSLYEGIKRGEIPAPRRLLTRGVRWLESDIDAFIDSLETAETKVGA